MKQTTTRVLYVDDEVLDRELMRDAIEHAEQSIELTLASSRDEFERAIAEETYDLVVTDFNILGYEGTQVLAQVHERWPQVPVIIVTGTGSEEIAVDAMKKGAADYIIKTPAAIERLPRAITAVLETTRLRREQRAAEMALRESEIRFRRAIYESPVPTMIYAEDGEIVTMSRSWELNTGYGQRDIPTVGDWVHRAYGPRSDEVFDRVGGNPGAATPHHGSELEVRCKDGSTRIWTFSSTPLGALPDGRSCTMTVANDVTEQRELEAKLRQAQKMEAVGRLAGGVAHDFNNMLQVIIGYASIAQSQEPDSPQIRTALEMILNASSRSADLTRQLLAFARMQAVEPRTVDAKAALDGIVRMLERVVGEQFSIECEVATGIGQLHIDPSQLDSLLANLVINARDAMPDGGVIAIEARNETLPQRMAAEHDVDAGDFCMITVSDTGTGMDQHTIEHIFEPFYTTKELGLGTGLGLSTVYGIATQNGGFVAVESEVDKGTTMRVYLPWCEGRDSNEETRADRVRDDARNERVVLLVEDDPEVLEITSHMMRRIGFQVVATGEPQHAVELMNDGIGAIDLVVTDVIMPQMNGHELVCALREIDPNLPALYTSGYPADAIGPKGILDADVHFLPKPFNQERLAAKIREVLEP